MKPDQLTLLRAQPTEASGPKARAVASNLDNAEEELPGASLTEVPQDSPQPISFLERMHYWVLSRS